MKTDVLDALVEEATVDCYNEAEQLGGLFCALEENLGLPFETTVLGVGVRVLAIEHTERDIFAVCASGGDKQRISLLQLPLPDPPPAGAEWIAAYRRWSGER